MYEWEDDEGPSRGRAVLIGGVIVALAAFGWFVVKPRLSDDNNNANQQSIVFDTTESSAPANTGAGVPATIATPAQVTSAEGSAVATTEASTASTSSTQPPTTAAAASTTVAAAAASTAASTTTT